MRSFFKSCAILLALAPLARGQDAPHPAFEELNRESQAMFNEVSGGIVRLQMPLPAGVAGEIGQSPLDKWNIDPDIRRRLDESQRQAPSGTYIRIEIGPTTQPANSGVDAPHVIYMRQAGFAPNCIGAVIDDQGDVLAPMYIDRESCAQQPVQLTMADGRTGWATYVGSDRQTNLTVLKLQNMTSTPLRLAINAPPSGSLVMLISVRSSASRLAVWEGSEAEPAAVINASGVVAGFAQHGQFLCGATLLPIAEQLIEHGEVRRALLGVRIGAVLPDDPMRRQNAALAAQPALRVLEVVPESAAAKAGIQPGDLILSLADKPIGDARTFFSATIAQSRGPTQIQLLRGTEKVTVTADLELK